MRIFIIKIGKMSNFIIKESKSDVFNIKRDENLSYSLNKTSSGSKFLQKIGIFMMKLVYFDGKKFTFKPF
jgi:hypothetical protein